MEERLLLKNFLKMKKKFVNSSLFLICFVIAFSSIPQVFAMEDLATNQARKNELEAESVRLNEVLDEARQGKIGAVDKKKVYEEKKSVVNQQISETNNEIEKQSKEIEEQERIIADRQKQLEEDREKLKVRVTAIYTAGESSAIDCILSANDFSDFMDKAYILKAVSNRDTLMIENTKALINKLNKEKDDLEENRQNLKAKKAELASKESEYINLIAETNNWLKQLDSTEQKALSDIDNNTLQMQEIDAKIEQYYEEQRLLEEQRKREEEQRKREEEQRLQEEARARELEEIARQRQIEQDRLEQEQASQLASCEDEPQSMEAETQKAYENVDSEQPEPEQSYVEQVEPEQPEFEQSYVVEPAEPVQPEPEQSYVVEPAEPEQPEPEQSYVEQAESEQPELEQSYVVEPAEPEQPEPEQSIGVNGLLWPVPGFTWLSSVFNEGRDGYRHGGIDIAGAGIYGTPILAADDGTVSTSWYCNGGWGGGYGTYCMIDHAEGKSTLYGHMSAIAVSPGEYVTKGQVIGYVGSTGESTGPHLHFETRLWGVKYDPMSEF